MMKAIWLILAWVPALLWAAETDYLDMPLEALLDVEITSAAKKEQSLRETAAAVYVITAEAIRRSGVTSLPEALRLAPGIQVARIDANKWAISARGFNNQFSNMLLVMIDGRTIYSPTISGVYWDAHDIMLEDVDRIEVIRGPGATLWGANAVNGVINIITRNARETTGGLLAVNAGNQERGTVSLRYGERVAEGVYGRVYLRTTDQAENWLPQAGRPAGDQWRGMRSGFRVDGEPAADAHWTVQGDLYRNTEFQTANYWVDPDDPASAPYAPYYAVSFYADRVETSGWNLLGRWSQTLTDGGTIDLQLYYDYNRRREAFATQRIGTFDVDFQHRFSPWKGHDLIWGLGWRRIEDDYDNTFMASMRPDHSVTQLYSAFIQDELRLTEQWRLVLGAKLEHNDYTGLEVQPSARLLWLASEKSTFWGALSRAVRSPSRMERTGDVVFGILPRPDGGRPLEFHVYGNERYQSEDLLALELGWRYQPRENLSLDLVAFRHQYDGLEVLAWHRDRLGIPYLTFENGLDGHGAGLELSLEWQPLPWWRIIANYTYFDFHREGLQSGALLADAPSGGLTTPRHQGALHAWMNLGETVDLDLWLQYMGALKRASYLQDSPVPAWTALNLRLAWRPRPGLELSLVGRNLTDPRHLEFVGESHLMPTEIERSLYVRVVWRF